MQNAPGKAAAAAAVLMAGTGREKKTVFAAALKNTLNKGDRRDDSSSKNLFVRRVASPSTYCTYCPSDYWERKLFPCLTCIRTLHAMHCS